MILSMIDVLELKKIAEEKYGVYIHFHDACGGMSLSIDEKNDDVRKLIEDYCAQKQVRLKISADGTGFIIE